MTNLSTKLFAALLLSLININVFAQKTQCHLKGEVIDRPESSMLYLTKKGGDFRTSKIEIPIIDNHFDYLLQCDYEEAYELAFRDEQENGAWRSIEFMAENGVVDFKLHPMNRNKENSVTGGPLNTEKKQFEQLKYSLFDKTDFNATMAALDKEKKVYNPQVYSLMDAFHDRDKNTQDSIRVIINQLQKENNYYSTAAYELIDKRKEQEKEGVLWEIEYLKNNISLVSYTQLINCIKIAKQIEDIQKGDTSNDVGHFSFLKIEALFDIFTEKYKKQYPGHPYTEQIENAYRAFNQVKVGEKFIDFEAPSFDGRNIKLSEQINGKIALIDLWASWCGPCRSNSLQIIPIYEAYKEKGFTVIGIAREENSESGIRAAEQDGYPWLNLLELKDKNKIWEKYGIGNSGGSTFLIDRNGIIMAIHPTPEEIEKILKTELK